MIEMFSKNLGCTHRARNATRIFADDGEPTTLKIIPKNARNRLVNGTKKTKRPSPEDIRQITR